MDNIQELRQKCISAIQQCVSAEQHAKQVESAASQQRQLALANARRKHAQMQQDIRNVLNEMNRLTSQAQLILTELRLKAEGRSAATSPQPGMGSNNLLRLMHNYQGEAKTALLRLRAAADELKEERRKWWKFW